MKMSKYCPEGLQTQFLDILRTIFACLVNAFVWCPCPMLARCNASVLFTADELSQKNPSGDHFSHDNRRENRCSLEIFDHRDIAHFGTSRNRVLRGAVHIAAATAEICTILVHLVRSAKLCTITCGRTLRGLLRFAFMPCALNLQMLAPCNPSRLNCQWRHGRLLLQIGTRYPNMMAPAQLCTQGTQKLSFWRVSVRATTHMDFHNRSKDEYAPSESKHKYAAWKSFGLSMQMSCWKAMSLGRRGTPFLNPCHMLGCRYSK